MVQQSTALDRLYELDKQFARGIDKLLHSENYIGQLMGLLEDDLTQVLDYLSDAIPRLTRAGESPRKCLHILRKISSARGVLPSAYVVSGTLSPSGSNPSAYGGSSEVQQGSLSARRDNVCIKSLRILRAGDREKIDELFRKEAIVWKYMNHPNIVPFKGVVLDPPQLVSEWMSGGELREYIKKNLSANRISLLLGVANGLEYLHSHGVIHGDLKGPNILVDASGNPRITDFGLSSIVRDPSSLTKDSDEYGYTLRWAAPETFQESPVVSEKSDVFSFAMVAFEIFSGTVPFPGTNSIAVPGIIAKGNRPNQPDHPSLTEPLWGLIQKCWSGAPKDRPEMGDVIKQLKEIKYNPPSKKNPEKSHAQIQGSSPTVGYDVGTPSSVSTPRSQKEKGKSPLVPQDTTVVDRRTTSKGTSRPPPPTGNNDPPTIDFNVGVEGAREHHSPPQEAKEDKNRRDLGRKQSRKDLEHWRRPTYAEMAAKGKVTPKEGQPDLSGSTTALPLQTNPSRPTTPGPSTQPPPKEGKPPPMPQETNMFGGGITNKSATRLPLTVGNNPLASGSKVTLEGGREPHEPPKGVRGGEDRKELGRRKSRKDRHGGEQNDGEEGAKKEKDIPEVGPHNPSGSTTAADSGIDVITPSNPPTPEPPSRRENNTATPRIAYSTVRVGVDQPCHRSTLPTNNAAGRPLAATGDNRSRGQTSDSPAGQAVRRDTPLPQPPMNPNQITQETHTEPAKCWEFWSAEWWKCNCTCCESHDEDAVIN